MRKTLAAMALLFAVQAAVGFLNVRVHLTRDYEILEVHLKEYARVFHAKLSVVANVCHTK